MVPVLYVGGPFNGKTAQPRKNMSGVDAYPALVGARDEAIAAGIKTKGLYKLVMVNGVYEMQWVDLGLEWD